MLEKTSLNKKSIIFFAGIIILFVAVICLVWCLQKKTKIADFQNVPISNIKTSGFTIPEVGVKVVFPDGYSLLKNNEQDRRGSFVSYDFQSLEKDKIPYFSELQFFSEESIKNFTKNCGDTMCFEGDYPNLTSYLSQKTAFAQSKNYQNFKLKKFGDSNWFVSNHKCTGDSCVIREYTTFLGNTKLDVWIMMANFNEEKQADVLFSQFKIE